MIRVDLGVRDVALRELMDDPECDLAGLRHTYAQFRVVNRLVAGWSQVYRRRIRPLLTTERTTTLLDIGSGGGDLARALSRWARRDGFDLAVTAIDPDDRAHDYATAQGPVAGVTFRRAGSGDLVAEGARFDVVVSNHLLHHLDSAELARVLADSDRLARRLVVHSDIARSRLAYLGWAVVSRPFGRRSFIHIDVLRSIRRSYRVAELAQQVGEPWRVIGQFPARVLLLRDTPAGPTATRRTRPASESIKGMNPAILFTAATTSYVANCALGTAVATRTISTRNAHWVHHALYISTSTLAGVAASSLLWSPSRAGWALLPAAVPLALIPRISSHSRRHILVALSAAPFFVVSLIKAWR